MRSDIDRILLGDNPFTGVDHLSQERSRERASKFDASQIAKVIDSALDSGAQGLACSAHPNMKGALGFMKGESYSREFGVYLIVPNAQSYVRLASEKGMLGLFNETFGKMSLKGKAKAVVGGGLSALTTDPIKMMKTYLDAEVSLFGKSLPKNARLKSLFLHELLTELIISFKMAALAREYVDFTMDSMGIAPGFVSRNYARFVDFALEAGLETDKIVVMTPFNKAGFQMNPTREACEERLSKLPETRVIAMSVLASGYLGLEEAAQYLRSLSKPVSCVVGVSSEAHARETFSFLGSRLT